MVDAHNSCLFLFLEKVDAYDVTATSNIGSRGSAITVTVKPSLPPGAVSVRLHRWNRMIEMAKFQQVRSITCHFSTIVAIVMPQFEDR